LNQIHYYYAMGAILYLLTHHVSIYDEIQKKNKRIVCLWCVQHTNYATKHKVLDFLPLKRWNKIYRIQARMYLKLNSLYASKKIQLVNIFNDL